MSKEIKIGKCMIGGGNKIAVQSMTCTDTADYNSTITQIKRLEDAGCDIVRLAVCNDDDIIASKRYVNDCNVPLVADIQFDYKIALECVKVGYDKIRFNPGNTPRHGLKELAKACGDANVSIRIGINSGSLESDIFEKYGRGADALVLSACRNIELLEDNGFDNIVVSVKSSNVGIMVDSYRKLSKLTKYPLHLGVTESGHGQDGVIKSSVGIGSLLLDHIGDTIRVSLTGDPVNEVAVAKRLLLACGYGGGCDIVSCPTCSRCKYDMEKVVIKCKELVANSEKNLKIAIMGCVVNGPNECKDADIGIAGGSGRGALFSKGNIVYSGEIDEVEKMFYDGVVNLLNE